MKAKVLHTIIQKYITPEILAINYDLDNLDIKYSADKADEYLIRFENPFGFKCIHERDMMDYWNYKTLTDNWILEITEGGWLDQEKSRSLISDEMFELREFLIEGIDYCVSVFSLHEPIIKPTEINK
ncbi:MULTISPECIES: hypothetical protein [Marinifilum]|uniref:hypothetical protein n=1 Tax=Marinifilum TaxID=866673 RepID=UPI0027D113A3|nr:MULTISPECIES: hypothetical protein [Marinifilum]MDQ2180660.1 hypothetical protein [Marinifilum sp. D714]